MHRKLIIDEEKINKIKQKGYLSVEEDICFNNIPEILRLFDINVKGWMKGYYILNDDGSIREGALGKLSYLAKCALNDFDRDGDWDTQEIVGCYIRGEIVHKATESTKTPGKTVTFVNLDEINPAEGFDTEISEKAQKIIDKGKAAGTSLSDLLG